jgi:hypothetical protein
MKIRKRKAVFVSRRRYADRKHRKPQSAFSVDIPGGMELDDTKNTWCEDNAIQALDVPLTTNKPREVEMINPETGLRERLFESCSAAARLTNINRTKMSRSKSSFSLLKQLEYTSTLFISVFSYSFPIFLSLTMDQTSVSIRRWKAWKVYISIRRAATTPGARRNH